MATWATVTSVASLSQPATKYKIELEIEAGQQARCACMAWRFSKTRWCKHLELAAQQFRSLRPARRIALAKAPVKPDARVESEAKRKALAKAWVQSRTATRIESVA